MAIRIEESPTRGILPEIEPVKSRTKQRMLHRFQKFFNKDVGRSPSPSPSPSPTPQIPANQCTENQQSGTHRASSRNVGVGLPRSFTFTRQNSEKRDRLEPIRPCHSERRALSVQRQQRAASAHQARSTSTPSPQILSRTSAPSLSLSNGISDRPAFADQTSSQGVSADASRVNGNAANQSYSPQRSPSLSSSERFDEVARDEQQQIDRELDIKWILNLSMHFRDKSDREKFFVTFAEEPNRWRRVTISCDYRNAEPDSLEMDLKELQYQRDKNAQIYQSLRDSLPSIQFYNTVTNLKLETEDGRLHVHVTEDVNEIIPYPPRLSVQHILSDRYYPIREARENHIHFRSHLSGFVYKVSFLGKEYIKKEIPGPDTVDEFLYEVNALHALSASTSVIKLEAIVLDDSGQTVKGLLISYAERGALVDLLYDYRSSILWSDRMRWARQAIQGLSEIHEEGYVQGDFTLSNIVIDSDDNAKIIDINRRGCPVGWEPPEIANKIASNQRISMYIGVKSDLYQLGMTLWALAMGEDEPERHDQPLSLSNFPSEVPDWFKDIVSICLSPQPRDRLAARELLLQFPSLPVDRTPHEIRAVGAVLDDRSPIRYIEPSTAVEREDLERLGRSRRRSTSRSRSDEDVSLVDPPSSSYQFDSGSSFVGIRRGRRPHSGSEHGDESDPGHRRSDEPRSDIWNDLPPQIISISPGREPRYEGFRFDADSNQIASHGQVPRSDQDMIQVGPVSSSNVFPESRLEAEAQALDDDLELPDPHQPPPEAGATSITSDSTPRNVNSMLATSANSIPPPPALDLATADLAGLGGHPVLDRYSSHEPMKTSDIQSSQYYDTHEQSQQQHFSDSAGNLIPENEIQSSDLTDTTFPANESQASNIIESPSEPLLSNMPDIRSVPNESDPLVSTTLTPEEKQPLLVPS